MPLPEISEQEMLFVEEYCKDRNAVRSALKAGYSKSYQSANTLAQRLLQNVAIKAWIKCLLRRQAKALKFSPSKVLKNWMLAASVDLTHFEVREDGTLDTVPGVPKEYLRMVRKKKHKIRTETSDDKTTTEHSIEIELRDPHAPEVKLMEHFRELTSDAPDVDDDELLTEFIAGLRAKRGRRANSASHETTPVDSERGATGDSISEQGG